MKKYTRTILALILAVVSAIALPISVSAVSVSGSIGTNAYVCHYNGSITSLSSNASCSQATSICLELTPTIDRVIGSMLIRWGEVNESKSTLSAKSLYYNKSYSEVRNSHQEMPQSGIFISCTYNTTITGITVVDNDVLSF